MRKPLTRCVETVVKSTKFTWKVAMAALANFCESNRRRVPVLLFAERVVGNLSLNLWI